MSGIHTLLCKIIQTRLGKRIIHNTIILISPQVRICIMPVFSDNNSIFIAALDCFSKCSPEIMADLIRYIQSPAIYSIFFKIMTADSDKILLHSGIGGIKLGHIITGSKCFIIISMFISLNPVSVNEEPVIIF